MTYAFIAVLLSWAVIWAQSVGIGTALPDPSARLHIEDSQRGLLIPRLPLSARNVAAPVTNPATGLLVFNTATAGAGSNRVWPGFYYWNGNEWVRLLVYPNEAWQIEGNFGTDPAIHFLGTIDNQPLRVRVNNQQTLQLNTNLSIQRDAGGNARGTGAVDLQYNRSAPDRVASGSYSVVSGGSDNGASAAYAVVSGGVDNIASGSQAFIGGGEGNRAEGHASVIGGGLSNTISPAAPTTFIGSGAGNIVSGFEGAIVGGSFNEASGQQSFIGGGQNNRAEGLVSVIGGGNQNLAQGIGAVIAGGVRDTIYTPAQNGVIGGGERNALRRGTYNAILGGFRNAIEADTSCIVGGVRNFIGSGLGTAFIGGGSGNIIEKTVVGGNVQGAVIAGGIRNRLTGYPNWAFIGGGIENHVETELSVICGGVENRIDISSPRTSGANVIVGGGRNLCRNYELQFIGGGADNHNESWGSAIVGGQQNKVYSASLVNITWFNFIGGGAQNEINEGSFSGILGGGNNLIDNFAWTCFIVGAGDTIHGGYGSVVLGVENTLTNSGGSMISGIENRVQNANYNYVFGRGIQPVSENYRMYCFGPGTPSSPSGFLVINRLDGDHPIHVGTNATNGNGAYLSAGGTWTDVSTKESKEGFIELDSVEVLRRVQNLWVGGWRYKGSEEYHIGPMAEDFHALFGTGKVDPRGLSAKDQAGVLFLAVKALAAENAALKAQKERLEERIAVLEERLSRLEGRFPPTLSSK